MTSDRRESVSPDPRDQRVDQRLRDALESGSLPRDLLICGPAGTGKTYGILTALHCLAADYPDLRILICRDTRVSLTESVLVTFEQEILPADGMEHIAAGCLRRTRYSYQYPSGSEIVCGGLDNPEKIKSTPWDIIFVNEAIATNEEAWEMLWSRRGRPGRDPRFGFLIGDTNPGDPAHFFRRRAVAGSTILWDTSHKANPRLFARGRWTAEGLAWIDGLKHLTGSRLKRLFLGLWAAGEGAWFEFGDNHISEAAEFDPLYPVHVGLDSGPDSAAVWVQFRPPGVVVFADYHSFARGAYGVAKDIITRSGEVCPTRCDFVCTDPAGRASTAIGPTVFEEYNRAGLKVHAWPLRTVLDSLALLESFVAVNPAEILVHPRCKHLIDAFANYMRAKRAGQWVEKPADPQHPYEDLIDALRGACYDKFPEGRKPALNLPRVKMGRVF